MGSVNISCITATTMHFLSSFLKAVTRKSLNSTERSWLLSCSCKRMTGAGRCLSYTHSCVGCAPVRTLLQRPRRGCHFEAAIAALVLPQCKQKPRHHHCHLQLLSSLPSHGSLAELALEAAVVAVESLMIVRIFWAVNSNWHP